MRWYGRNDVANISDEEMDRKYIEYANLAALAGYFWGVPFYASPDGRTLPPMEAL